MPCLKSVLQRYEKKQRAIPWGGLFFSWKDSNQSWTGSNPPLPSALFRLFGIHFKEMRFFHHIHKLDQFMKGLWRLHLGFWYLQADISWSYSFITPLQCTWLEIKPLRSKTIKAGSNVIQLLWFQQLSAHLLLPRKTSRGLETQAESDRCLWLDSSPPENSTSKRLQSRG